MAYKAFRLNSSLLFKNSLSLKTENEASKLLSSKFLILNS